jgi:translation initiation factor RLI1
MSETAITIQGLIASIAGILAGLGIIWGVIRKNRDRIKDGIAKYINGILSENEMLTQLKEDIIKFSTNLDRISANQQLVMYDRIHQAFRFYADKGEVDSATYRVLEDLFEKYEQSGGNGEVQNLMRKIRKFKIM